MQVEITGGTILLDPEDAGVVEGSRWYVNNGYARRNFWTRVDGKKRCRTHILHRYLMGLGPGSGTGDWTVDHLNGNTLDNRRINLALVTILANAQNQRPQRTWKGAAPYSAHRGVSYDASTGHWIAQVGHNGKRVYCARFSTEEEAATAARDERVRLGFHGKEGGHQQIVNLQLPVELLSRWREASDGSAFPNVAVLLQEAMTKVLDDKEARA